MNIRSHTGAVVGICLSLAFGSAGYTQTPSPARNPANKEAVMTTRASGTFEVKLTPQETDEKSGEAALGRMSIDKQFHGDLEGTSKGEMLSAMTSVKGSAGYIAIERVNGTLQGHTGSFVLQHTGTMARRSTTDDYRRSRLRHRPVGRPGRQDGH